MGVTRIDSASASTIARFRAAAARAANCSASALRLPRGSGIASTTAADINPTIVSTISSSTRVKPSVLPVADIRIVVLAAFAAVGAVGIDVEGAALAARRGIMIGVAPGVVGQSLHETLADQRLEPLARGRIIELGEAIHLRRLLQQRDIGFRLLHPRRVLRGQDVDDHHRREQADDDDHHHQLDEGEACLTPPPVIPAEAGIQAALPSGIESEWIPAFAGMTVTARQWLHFKLRLLACRVAGWGAGSTARSGRRSLP